MSDDLKARLLRFADIEDGGGCCDNQFQTSPSREAADRITELERQLAERDAKIAKLEGWAKEQHVCADQLTAAQAERARCREALAYMIRAYEHESDAEDTLLMVPEGSSVFSVASARAALEGKGVAEPPPALFKPPRALGDNVE